MKILFTKFKDNSKSSNDLTSSPCRTQLIISSLLETLPCMVASKMPHSPGFSPPPRVLLFCFFCCFPLSFLTSTYCYVPDLPSSTIFTHSPGQLTQTCGFKSIHMLITSIGLSRQMSPACMSPKTSDTSPPGCSNNVFQTEFLTSPVLCQPCPPTVLPTSVNGNAIPSNAQAKNP